VSRSGIVILGVLPLLCIVGFVVTVLLLLEPSSTSACATDAGPGGPSPGNLGGVQGTGITAGELAIVRSSAGPQRFSGGTFASTAYGPPWGVDRASGIDQGAGIATAGGLRLNGGAPHKYFVAVDPSVISLGQFIYAWPNPFGWRGAFLAADSGGLVNGKDLDFYDWRGRDSQLAWSTPVEVSNRPISAFATGPIPAPPTTTVPSPGNAPPVTADCAAAAPAGSLGELSGTPQEIVDRVVAYAHDHGFADVTPASVARANATHGPTISGGRSDHQGPPDEAWAADISNAGSPTKEMDALAATIAGAFAIQWQGSGLVSAGNDDYRLQLIYRTCGGGDHFNHVHFGVRRGPGPRPAVTQPSTPRPC